MSELKTNKVSPATGTALAIGDSGDTITVPSGATLDISASTLTPPATMPASSGVNLTALNATEVTSGTLPIARVADNAVTLAKMAGITRGSIIVGDASGDPSALAVGTDTYLLTSDGTDAAWAVASAVVKKIHYFENTTRTSGTHAAGNQLTITSAFIPLDPTNNDLLVTLAMPTINDSNYHSGAGLRFSKSGGSDYDYMGYGRIFSWASESTVQLGDMINFVIPAGAIAAGTYTVYFRTESDGSDYFIMNPNSTDGARISTQMRTTLTITEFDN